MKIEDRVDWQRAKNEGIANVGAVESEKDAKKAGRRPGSKRTQESRRVLKMASGEEGNKERNG